MRDKKSIDSIDTETVESAEFLDLGFSEIPRKPFHGKQTQVQGCLVVVVLVLIQENPFITN